MQTWGYILDAPGRPSKADQVKTLSIMGVDVSEFGCAWCDRIRRGSTRPQNQLEERNALLAAVQSGDSVVVAAPFCLGLSAKDAEWFLGELAKRGVSTIVNGDVEKILPGDNTAHMIKRVASAQNVHHVRAAKGRAKRKSK